MLVTEFLTQNKFINFLEKNIFNKMFFLSLIINFIFIIIGLFSLIWIKPYVLYGFLYGFFWSIISYFFIFVIEYFLFNKRKIIYQGIIFYVIRIIIFIISFLLCLFLINFSISNQNIVKLFWKPINIFSFIFSYMSYSESVIFLPLLEKWLKNIRDLKIKRNYKDLNIY